MVCKEEIEIHERIYEENQDEAKVVRINVNMSYEQL